MNIKYKYIVTTTLVLLIILGIDYSFFTTGSLGRYIIRFSLLLSILIFEIIYSAMRRRIVLKKESTMVLFGIYIIYCFLSTMYAAIPLETFAKSVEVALVFYFINIVATYHNDSIPNLIEFVIKAIMLILAINAIGGILLPDVFTEWSRGIIDFQIVGFLHQNANGSLAALVIFYCIYKGFYAKSKKCFLIIPFYFIFMMIEQSRTSLIILCFLCLVLVLGSKNALNKIVSILFSCFVAVVILIPNSQLIYTYFRRGQSEGNFESMSGRTNMWEGAVKVFKENPLFGFGFGSGSSLVLSKTETNISSLHSGFFELLTGLGLLGVLILTLITVSTILKLYLNKNNESGFKVLIAGCYVYVLIRSMTSMGYGAWYSIDYLLFMCVLLFNLYQPNKERSL